MAALYPTEDTFPGLPVLVIWSHAIVTCDNSELTRDDSAAGNDEPRMGIALDPAPLRRERGVRRRCLRRGARSRVLTRALDAHDAALVAPGHGLAFSEAPSRELEEAEPFLARGDVDPRRIFSYRRVLAIPDQTPWEPRVAKPDASFWGLPQAHQSRRYARLGEAALLAFTRAALSARSSLRRGAVLRRKVAEQTRELGERNEQLASILDNTDEGFVVLDKRLRAASQGSAAFRAWFGEVPSSGGRRRSCPCRGRASGSSCASTSSSSSKTSCRSSCAWSRCRATSVATSAPTSSTIGRS